MHYTFYPQGVCSRKIELDIENGRVHNIHYLGGCNGNLKALGALAEGMTVEEVIQRLTAYIAAKGAPPVPISLPAT